MRTQRPLTATLTASIALLAGCTSQTSSDDAMLALPADAFYVSIAPFVESTHECYFHSLTPCQGELEDESVEVKVTDLDGSILVQETATTQANGFVGYWLPRDLEGTIEIRPGRPDPQRHVLHERGQPDMRHHLAVGLS